MTDRHTDDSEGAPWGRRSRADASYEQTATPAGHPSYVRDLTAAAKSRDAAALRKLIDSYLADGILPHLISEEIIPAVARQLGDEWVADVIGFDRVTIGCSRLTTQVRRLQGLSPTPLPHHAPQVLCVVINGADHTLGATVLAGLLRRHGLDVTLSIGTDSAVLANKLQQRDYDAVIVSAAIGEDRAGLRSLFKSLREARHNVTLIAGGPFFTGDTPSAAERTLGADYITNNIHEAIRLCETNTNPLHPKTQNRDHTP